MSDRQRCLVKGCNPYLASKEEGIAHSKSTGHRTAKWPVRSAEGESRARERNKNGYYRKYNANKPLLIEDTGLSAREKREIDYYEEYGITEEDEHLDADYQDYVWAMQI